MKRNLLSLVVAAGCLLTLTLAGCNTMHGFGEDLQHLGNSIGNAAK
ncbi:entericidin A/B family lipoprotein [Caballeronia sp. LZ001]|nr:entericidin A/B family lipoprotein [Caballeronia sp. LZ001]MDR5800958.1 entericidin A/B family lipoprotein [Caballeronia sp. LZ001]